MIFPMDLFGRGRDPENYQEIMDLKVNAVSGVYDVVAATNWKNTAEKRTISITDELVLAPGQNYLVFDYWQEKLIGKFSGDFALTIPPHGTRVVTVRQLSEQPQLVATNRHITGAFSIKKLVWDEDKSALHGTSATVPGALYKLFIYVPKGYSVKNVSVSEVKPEYTLNADGILEVQFMGQTDPVEWNITFTQ